MKRNIWLSALGLLSVLGLFSCSSERPDTWSLTEPSVQASGMEPVRASLASKKSFPGESELIFREAEVLNSVLDVTATCGSKIGEVVGSFKTDLPKRIALKSLWPSKLFLSLNETDLKKSSCSFKFIVTNEKGSTHSFEISNIQLSNFVTPSDLEWPTLITQSNLEESYELIKQTLREGDYTETFLVCENFWNQQASRNKSLLQSDSIRELFYGPLSAKNESLKDSLDPRVQKTEQTCRLFSRSSQNHETSSVLLSRDFKVRFHLPQLAISLNLFGQNSKIPSGTRFSWLDIEIENKSRQTTAIAFENTVKTLRFQKVVVGRLQFPDLFSGKQLARSQKIVSAQTRTEASTSNPTWTKGVFTVLELSPGSKVTLQHTIETDCFKLTAGLQTTPDLNLLAERGLYFDFDHSPSVYQLHNWTSGKTDALSSREELQVLHLSEGTAQPQNFMPLRVYEKADGYISADPDSDLPNLPPTGSSYDLSCLYLNTKIKL